MRMLTGNETTALKVADKLLGLRKVTQHTPSATEDLFRMYAASHAMGHRLKCKYVVGLSLYQQDGPLYRHLKDALSMMATDANMGELPAEYAARATDVRWPPISADVDSVKAGTKQIVRITGTPASEFEVTFLDNQDSEFMKTLSAINGFMFPVSGLMRPPAEYALLLNIGLGERGNIVQEWSQIVALQNVSLDASARDVTTIMEIPVTFTQLDPFIKLPTTRIQKPNPRYEDNARNLARDNGIRTA